MLVKKKDPDGRPYWVRKKFDRGMFTFPPHAIENIASWRDRGTFAELLEERGGPFLATYGRLGRVEHDGKVWERFTSVFYEHCVDVEVKADGTMGEIVAVPPEEAWKLALERDKVSGVKIVMEE